MGQVSVLLTEEQTNELREYIYSVTLESIQEVKKDAGMDKPFLKQKHMAEWLGISTNSLKKLERYGLPSREIDGLKFFHKQKCVEWILTHGK